MSPAKPAPRADDRLCVVCGGPLPPLAWANDWHPVKAADGTERTVGTCSINCRARGNYPERKAALLRPEGKA